MMTPGNPQAPGHDGRGSGGGGGAAGGNSRKRRSAKNRQGGGQAQQGGNARSSSGSRRRAGGADFWGRPTEGPPSDRKVRPTIDPGAVVRSLGDPPLGPNPATAAHHLTAIYEEAVRAATALAAANGLLEDDEL
jgi:hypothetical protein